VELLRLCWLVTDGICSKRLAPFLPELLHRLRHRQALRQFPVAVQAHVAGITASVDRALKPFREQTSGAGQFLCTLSMVDVATGWVACAGLRDKRQEMVFHALRQLQANLPFRILGLDSDDGTEFINRALLDYCTEYRITFTRSRDRLEISGWDCLNQGPDERTTRPPGRATGTRACPGCA
jgi:hypothetical protein